MSFWIVRATCILNLIVLLTVASVIAVSNLQPVIDTPLENQSAEAWQFSHATCGYSISLPADWEPILVRSFSPKGELYDPISFMGPLSRIGMFNPKITIRSREVDPGVDFDESFDEFVSDTKDSGSTIHGTGTAMLNDVEASWFAYTSPDGDVSVLQYVVTNEQSTHFITCIAPKDAFEFHRYTYEAIVETFELGK